MRAVDDLHRRRARTWARKRLRRDIRKRVGLALATVLLELDTERLRAAIGASLVLQLHDVAVTVLELRLDVHIVVIDLVALLDPRGERAIGEVGKRHDDLAVDALDLGTRRLHDDLAGPRDAVRAAERVDDERVRRIDGHGDFALRRGRGTCERRGLVLRLRQRRARSDGPPTRRPSSGFTVFESTVPSVVVTVVVF